MHASAHIRRAFLELVDGGVVEGELLFDNYAAQEQWDRMDNEGQLQALAGWLWYCTDIMPRGNYDALDDLPEGSTYAEAAQHIREQ